jgi:hypothetical protein
MLKACYIWHLTLAAVLVAVSITLAAAQSPQALLVDKGGRVLTDPTVSAIYVGDYWNTSQGLADQAHIDAFLPAWLKGLSVTAVLSQYRVATASFTSSDKVAGAAPFEFTDDDAQALVQQELAAGRIVSGDQAVHVIYLPPGTFLTFLGNSSARKLAGYHASFIGPLTGKRVYYAVVVYNSGTNGLDFNGNPQNNNTIITSRVLSGAFTNPDARQGTAGWIDDVNGEVGDVAFSLSADASLADTFTFQNSFAVVLLWSNKDEKLDAGTATPPPATSTVLSVTPTNPTIAQGASATLTVSNAETATDTLTLAVNQLPANVTATFADTEIAPGASTTLTLTVDAAAASSTSTFTVTGTAGDTTESVAVTLTIGTGGGAAAQADFSLTATPTSQDVIRRGTVTFTVTSAKVGDGEASLIKLKALHVRSALRVSLSTNRMAMGESVTVTVRPTKDAPRKSYEFILKGSSDRADVSIPLTVVVTK